MKWKGLQPGISCKTSPKYQVQRGWPPASPPPLNNRAKTWLQFQTPSFGCLSFGFGYRHIWLLRTVSNSCSFHLNFEVKCFQTRSGWEVPPNSIDAMQFGFSIQSVAHVLHKIQRFHSPHVWQCTRLKAPPLLTPLVLSHHHTHLQLKCFLLTSFCTLLRQDHFTVCFVDLWYLKHIDPKN